MTIRTEDRGAVRTITLDDSATRNAIDPKTLADFSGALRDTLTRDDLRVVVVTGAGKDFCSGANLAADNGPGRHPMHRLRAWGELITLLNGIPQATVARLRGVAVGAAANIALSCDFVVADDTLRFSEIFPRRALSPDAGGSWLLPHTVGLLRAKRLAILGDIVEAQEALELGLVTTLVAPQNLDTTVAALVERLVRSAPVALAQTRMLLRRGASSTLEQALDLEGAVQVVNMATDAPEAKRAFQAREEPNFTGQWRPHAPRTDEPEETR